MRKRPCEMKRAGIHFLIFSISGFLITPAAVAQDSVRTDLGWFQDAKLGIFIHWGIYSVDGVGESWSFHNKAIPHADYMKQIKGFTADKYDPAAWAELIQRSGARYAVITTKHHDGVALYDSKLKPGKERRPLSVVERSPAKRDVIAPFFAELRKRELRCGAYFSLIDWSDDDYPGFLRDSSRYAIQDDPARWQRFLRYNEGQINEIADQFRPDLWWFDGDWEHSAEEWRAKDIRAMILKKNPKAIINGRLQGFGDYATPEQNIPIETPKTPAWELCMTIGSDWGWQPQDTLYKSTHDLIAIFADVIGHGGNLLLDIGPKEDGTIPPGQVKVLEDFGTWTGKHAEAIYGTRAGLPNGHFFGPTTLSPDSTTLYLFLANGMSGSVEIKGLDNKIVSTELLSTGQQLQHRVVGKIGWSKVPGLVFIDVPLQPTDPWMGVVKVKLDGPVKLYRGEGGFN
jgi:alpha-L-fucosidase